MQEAILHPTPASEPAEASWRRRSERKPGTASRSCTTAKTRSRRSAPGTARRAALDDALAEMDAGGATPSPRWKVRYGLMLGLERVLASPKPATAAGTELRRHQIDALAGMLTELIAANQRAAEENGNGTRDAELEPEVDRSRGRGRPDAGVIEDEDGRRSAFTATIPGASRRYRFRHPTASGKTIAAAGFVEAARHLGILILTHRRLLVTQFTRDLTTEGYGDRLTARDRDRLGAAARRPDHDPDLRLVRAPRRLGRAARRTSS